MQRVASSLLHCARLKTQKEESQSKEEARQQEEELLNDCCMCLRSLTEIKAANERFKVTECGHVFCLGCMNKWYETRRGTYPTTDSEEFKCPVCMQSLLRDDLIRVSNIYI